MRIFIKGGSWKNSEDEILKAAVMKYGKNQWARVASLLNRKSAKQCKARWHEWLDPSIKKTEWSKEEEEKLLHLAKMMPCQWRTIAPIVGRTAAQCLEHYEKLLDQAQGKEEGYDPENDPRRLRPGEIDPHPETKPARPDALDMDEDEKEMLSEARARLANTRGKKAKRKARERQLEEARRLAALQKKRELRAAGIEAPSIDRQRMRRRGIDMAREIPFHQKPAAGPFDTTEEQVESKQAKLEAGPRTTVQDIEGRRRDDIEKEARKKDQKKRDDMQKKDLEGYFEKINQKNDPEATIRPSPLIMPDPQITESELHQIAKMGVQSITRDDSSLASGTPRTTLGGATPMRGATPAYGGAGATPMHGGGGYMGGATPNIHAGRGGPSKAALREERGRRESLGKALANLPAVENDYDIDVKAPEVEGPDSLPKRSTVDQGQIDAQLRENARKAFVAEQRRRSSAVQRDLPRPAGVRGGTISNDARGLVASEVRRLVGFDALAHPMVGKAKKKGLPPLDFFTDAQLQEARDMLEREVTVADMDLDEVDETSSSFLYLPNPVQLVPAQSASKAQRLDALRHEFEVRKHQLIEESVKAAKLQDRLGVLTKGYNMRAAKLSQEVQRAWEELQEAELDLKCFQELKTNEELAVSQRMLDISKLVEVQKAREAQLQALFKEKAEEHRELAATVAATAQKAVAVV